jgi:hypothetical protein
MAMGGFNGSDPTPTLAEFQAFVRDGAIRSYIAGASGIPGGGGPGGAAGGLSAITTWVQEHFESRVIAGVTLYDLRRPIDAGALSANASV